MEKLTTKIMNSFEKFLEAYDTCSKSEVIYNWSALKKEIEKVLEEKEEKNDYKLFNYYECPQCKNGLIADRDKEQVIRCECGVKYYVYNNCITPIKEAETNSWQDGDIRKWKCGCDSVMACETGSDSVITCLKCHKKYAWDDKLKRLTQVTDVWLDKTDTFIDPEKVYEYDKKMKEQFYKITLKNSKSN